jgi:hypothetical protein
MSFKIASRIDSGKRGQASTTRARSGPTAISGFFLATFFFAVPAAIQTIGWRLSFP